MNKIIKTFAVLMAGMVLTAGMADITITDGTVATITTTAATGGAAVAVSGRDLSAV